jgi:hypothetical protein
MHVSLYTGVFWAYVTQRGPDAACCASPRCGAGTFETCQHLFLACPDAAAAADWLLDLWAAVVGPSGVRPPRTAAVLLADDHRAWQPAGDALCALWTALRVSWLQAAWDMRCRRLLDPERCTVSPAGIVAATVAAVTKLLRRDYARTLGDVRTQTAAPSGWFRGTQSPKMTTAEFLERWGHRGVLCRVGAGVGGRPGQLEVLLKADAPVRLQRQQDGPGLGAAVADGQAGGVDAPADQQQPVAAA